MKQRNVFKTVYDRMFHFESHDSPNSFLEQATSSNVVQDWPHLKTYVVTRYYIVKFGENRFRVILFDFKLVEGYRA